MFPVDSDTHEYDELMINIFNNLPNNTVLPDIRTLLPKILVAGDDAGVLTKKELYCLILLVRYSLDVYYAHPRAMLVLV